MTSSPAELVFASTADFAGVLGASDSYVRRLKRTGKLVMDERGRIVVAASLAKLGRVLDPARGGDRTGRAESASQHAGDAPAAAAGRRGEADDDRLNYNVQAAREKLAAAQLRELELAREAGELVLKDARDSAEFGRARAGREAILSIPDRLAVQVAAMTDATDVHALLLAECRRVCNQLAALPDAVVPHD